MRRAISCFKSLPGRHNSPFSSAAPGFDAAVPVPFPGSLLKLRQSNSQCSSPLLVKPFTVISILAPPTPLSSSVGGFRSLDASLGRHLVKFISSSANSVPAIEWNEPVACSEVVGEDHLQQHGAIKEDAKPSIPVRAYFFCTSVNLRSLVQENKDNFIPTTSRMTNYVVLKFGSLSSTKELGARLSGSDCPYMVVFQYGSIVLFNIPENVVDGYLQIVERHATGLLPEAKKDEYEVIEKPTLSTWMEGGLDYIMLQYLSVDAIRTIGSVLGQSIALDYYVRQVDDMVAKFTDINCSLEKTGTFEMDKKNLFQLLGKANSTLSDVILKLGLFERSDIAWKDAKYAQIWEYLRDEFELSQRFANLDFKLKFVEHNTRFLQEILQNRKSDFLEWMIIVLIAGEFLLSVYHTILTFKGQ